MAASFFIDVPRRCVFTRVWGELADDDLFGHTFAIREHPAFDPSFAQVMDYREVARVSLATDSVRQLAEHNPWRRGAPRAFIASQGLIVGLARLYQMSGDEPAEGVRIVSTWDEACEWAGLEATAGWPSQAPDWSTAVRT